MSAPIISVYLGPLRAKWDQYCLSRGVKGSTALKQVVQHLLSKETGPTPLVSSEHVVDGKKKRIEIRLASAELVELQRRSFDLGFSPNRMVNSLIHAYLSKSPVFGQYELDALTSSNSQLLMLGRNLNQIARQLNISVENSDHLKLESIEEVRRAINSHTQRVAQLIESNVKRWQGGKHE